VPQYTIKVDGKPVEVTLYWSGNLETISMKRKGKIKSVNKRLRRFVSLNGKRKFDELGGKILPKQNI